MFPGGSIGTTVSETDDFAFARSYRLIELEVRPDDPYSVLLRCVVIEGKLYLDAAPARKWGQLIRTDSRVRVKLGEAVYQATAKEITDKYIIDRFITGRTIYRLEPGWPN